MTHYFRIIFYLQNLVNHTKHLQNPKARASYDMDCVIYLDEEVTEKIAMTQNNITKYFRKFNIQCHLLHKLTESVMAVKYLDSLDTKMEAIIMAENNINYLYGICHDDISLLQCNCCNA